MWQEKLEEFIRFHITSSPNGSKWIHLIRTDDDIKDVVKGIATKLQLQFHVMMPTSSDTTEGFIASVREHLEKGACVFLFLSAKEVQDNYSDIRNISFYTHTSDEEFLGRFFLITKNDPAIDWIAHKLGDFSITL